MLQSIGNCQEILQKLPFLRMQGGEKPEHEFLRHNLRKTFTFCMGFIMFPMPIAIGFTVRVNGKNALQGMPKIKCEDKHF